MLVVGTFLSTSANNACSEMSNQRNKTKFYIFITNFYLQMPHSYVNTAKRIGYGVYLHDYMCKHVVVDCFKNGQHQCGVTLVTWYNLSILSFQLHFEHTYLKDTSNTASVLFSKSGTKRKREDHSVFSSMNSTLIKSIQLTAHELKTLAA